MRPPPRAAPPTTLTNSRRETGRTGESPHSGRGLWYLSSMEESSEGVWGGKPTKPAAAPRRGLSGAELVESGKPLRLDPLRSYMGVKAQVRARGQNEFPMGDSERERIAASSIIYGESDRLADAPL